MAQEFDPTQKMSRAMAAVAVVVLFLAACGSVLGGESDLDLRPERVPPAQFRIRCDYSHSNYDDPVLRPNQLNGTHLHDYFGFKGANAFTTNPTAFIGKPTTCVHTADAAAYIFPALFQRKARRGGRGKALYEHLKPKWTLFYYRTAVSNPETIKTIPRGLTMVTGSAMAGLVRQKCVDVQWWCGVYGKHYSNFPEEACAPGVALIGKLNFPSCWDGKRIRTPDGKAHMLLVKLNTTCPPSHPIAIPRISIKVYYPVRAGLVLSWPRGGMSADPPLYLSSYHTGGSGSGFEYHSDFMNGWEPKKLQELISTCINANIKCRVFNNTKINEKPFLDGPHCGTPTKKKACT